MTTNSEMLKKLTLGVEDTQTVCIDYEGIEAELTLRPLTSGELTKLQVIEKKPLEIKIGMRNGRRETVQTNANDVNVNTGDFTEAQQEAMYTAVALSLSVGEEKFKPDQIKDMRAGLPEIIFEKVIEISKLSDEDLTLIKQFRKDE